MRSRRLGIASLSVVAVGAAVSAGWYASWYYYPTVQAGPQDAPDFAVSQEQHAARGYGADSARVDSQITFRIPDGQAGAVYQYLKSKYVGQTGILQDQFPEINLHGQPMSDVSIFTDEYYDTPTLDLYKTTNSTRHRTRVNTTNPEDRKSGRELVQMKLTPPGQFTLRSEFKYKVKRSGQRKTLDDLHPLMRLISKSQRQDFKKVFADAGIDAHSLKHIFTIRQTRSRGYLNWDDTNILSFSVDEGSASILWAKGTFSSVDLGLVEIAYTEANEAKRKKMWEIRDAIVKDLQDHFPGLTKTSDSKYGIVLAQLMREIPLIPALFRVS
jgi:hypothetical protein